MNKREFNAAINAACVKVRGKKILSAAKARALPSEVRDGITKFLVRQRGQIMSDLLPDNPDWRWLAACGYMYRTKSPSTNFNFIHTCEHQIR